MKIKRFFAKDMRTALAEVKEVLGNDAVIMSNQKVTGGVEIVAAIDNEMPHQETKKIEAKAQMEQQMRNVQQSRELADDKVHIRRQLPSTLSDSESVKDFGNKFSNLLDRYHQPNNENGTEAASEEDSLQALIARQNKQRRSNKLATFSNSSESHRFSSDTAQSTDHHFRKKQEEKSLQLEKLYRDKQVRSTHLAFEQHKTNDFSRKHSRRTESGNSSRLASDEMHDMRQEMASIRNLLEHQLSGLIWQEVERKEPLRAMLIKRLEKLGLSQILADQLASYIPEDIPANYAWGELLELLSDQVITTQENLLETGGVIALLGPTGVGKTTTVAKLAARAAMDFGAEDIALVTTDTFRIGAQEQLSTYGRILGCPVKVAKDADELTDILYQLRHRRLVLLDTAGMGQRDLRLSEQLDALMQSHGSQIRSLLVLPATSQRRVLQETIDHFCRIPLSGCVLTKLDESLSLGEILSVIVENALPVTYFADGQRVPEDIRQANGRYLVEKASELMLQHLEKENHFWSHDVPESNAADFYD